MDVVDDDLLDACVPVLREAFGTVAGEFGLTPETAPTNAAFIDAGRLRDLADRGCRTFALLDEDGQPIGCVSLRPSRVEGAVDIERLAVLPRHRHHGHGSALLDHAVAVARGLGATAVAVGIIDENTRLKTWYLAKGFTETGTRTFDHLPFTVCFLTAPVT